MDVRDEAKPIPDDIMAKAREIVHEITEEGESTKNWAIQSPGFMGSIRQLTCCARCGENIKKHPNEPTHTMDIFKPTMHSICDECFEALP